MQLSASIFARGKRQQRRTVEAATRINRDGRTARVGWRDEKEKEKTQRENTPSRGICWALLRGLFGSSPVVRGRHRFPSLAHLPFPFSPPSPLPPLSIPLVRKEEGHLSMEVGEGGGRFSSGLSLSDGWFYPNAINSPTTRVYMPRGWNSPFVLFPFALSRIAPLPTDLAERRISSLVTCHRWRNVFESHSLRKEEENREEEARRILKARGKCPFNNLFIEIFLRY